MSSEHITYMGRSKCFLTYSCLALAMRDVFANGVALLTRNAVAKRCVLADLYTWFIYNTLCNRLKLAGSTHILHMMQNAKCMDAQRRTVLIFGTRGVGCASCMCDWGIKCMLSLIVLLCLHSRLYLTKPTRTSVHTW